MVDTNSLIEAMIKTGHTASTEAIGTGQVSRSINKESDESETRHGLREIWMERNENNCPLWVAASSNGKQALNNEERISVRAD